MFKKKKIKNDNNGDSFVSGIKHLEKETKNSIRNLKINFSASERRKVMSQRENNRIIPFAAFLELFENILLNNKMKPGFSISKGFSLLDDGRFPIYKKIAIISNIIQKEELLSKDKNYTKYSLLFEEKNINKEIFILGRIKEIFKRDIEYKAVTSGPVTGIVGNLLFGVILIFFNLLVVYGGLLDTGSIGSEVFNHPLKGAGSLDKFVIHLLYGTYYIDSSFIKILAVLKSTYFFLFLTFLLYYSFSTLFTFFSTYRKREIDKLANEGNFLEILRIRINQLEIQGGLGNNSGRRKFQYKNFLELVKSSILYSLEKGYTNQDFTNDILQVFTLYLVYRKFPEKTKLTEGFQNLLKMILDAYYSMLSGTNNNFDLGVVDDWIKEYKVEIENLQWEKQFTKTRGFFGMFGNLLTSATIVLMLMLSLSQGQTIEKLIKLTMK